MSLQIKLSNTTFVGNLPTTWLPTTIASDIRVWGKADVGASVNSGSRIYTLSDQSGLAHNITSSVTTKVPPYDTAYPRYTTNVQNNLPAFFNDSGFGLTRWLATTANPFASAVTHLTPFSVAIAFKRNPTNFMTEALLHQMTMHNNYYWQGWGIFLGQYYAHGMASFWMGNTFAQTSSSQILVNGSTPLNAGSNYVLVINYSGSGQASGVSMYVNANQETTSILDDSLVTGTLPAQTTFISTLTSGTVSTTAGLSVGDSWEPCSANSDYYYEFLVFDRVLSPVESHQCSSYLNQRWGIY